MSAPSKFEMLEQYAGELEMSQDELLEFCRMQLDAAKCEEESKGEN